MTMSEYAFKFIGVRYRFGGNSPILGLDCSGLACEVLRAFGYLGKEDLDAQRLFDYLRSKGWQNGVGDCAFLFFGTDIDDIRHVGIQYGSKQMVEAGGGDSSTKTPEDADERMAFVRLRPMTWRKDFIAGLRP